MFLTWNVAESYFVMLQKNDGKDGKITAIEMLTSINMSIFLKYWACLFFFLFFFSKINLMEARKKILKVFFLAFESQDNIQIEYLKTKMLMLLKNGIKRC